MIQTTYNKLMRWFLHRPRATKRILSVLIDYVVVMLVLWSAFSLRLSTFYIPPQTQWWLFLLAPLIAIPIFIKLGLYRAIVRYIGLDALWTIFKAISLFTLIFATVVVLSGPYSGLVPRTIYIINAILLFISIGGLRLYARWLFISSTQKNLVDLDNKRYIPPVLIYGAGRAGAQLSALLKMGRQLRPVAFIDDEPTLYRQQINGLNVYRPRDLVKLIDKFHVRDVLLAIPSASRSRRSEILLSLEEFPVHIRTLPDLTDIAEGKLEVSDIQEVDIADLLGREAVAADPSLLSANISQKCVMVTGAGGSIGSELSRQIIKLNPSRLLLFEISEFALYQIEQELSHLEKQVEVIALLGSVVDRARLTSICQHFSVQTIYHAAAYKHVPMVEKNVGEGIRNNVFGTLHCAQAAIAAKVETFVLVSTDKAVRPTNTMGASKRMAELVLQALAQSSVTRFTMVRFGNVLGSSGSVVPLFREQIAKGGPVTVTDPQIIRYFMTIPEAAELVIQAGAMGQGGDVFVLDMGSAVKIVDLAKRMIHLSGFTVKNSENPDGDIEITFTGLRPGEKLFEELLIGENVSQTAHQKIMRAEENVIPWQDLQLILTDLQHAVSVSDYEKLRTILGKYVDGFMPQCGIEDWLSQKVVVNQ
ncbi:polysaccharide biosynthesis protein [Methylophaga muralis]|uniref:UDP-N-acetyl-alpha-D-glucosamine C6 dehydratase n=1 Tax=Methylophaga muralis TaxID=291169 RepID=A0A1E3GSP5_9GAMM|nr:nucleoside-diphosphate sugar epimerase/dehydratase [Methylophaga muralis]ODN67069.1 UDP-N-acetyl-alpha-D-glucosamine C6 dehydratase [Methylophaga muralis]